MTWNEVLLAQQDPDLGDQMAVWIEEAGHEVLLCPGPSAPRELFPSRPETG